ncbi:MAG: malonate transporter subunit MadM, partial [Clostridia bacterium]|nr:malonate transporter subunit MadM [Clostridia bacterium]
KCGLIGIISVLLGVIVPYIAGVIVSFAFGYRDAVSVCTIASGAVTFIVGPVTGTALGADSTVITISIAAGVIKSIIVMIITPVVAKYIGLVNPRAAMIYGGLAGTTSGTTAGLAATDPSLVPYAAMTSTFHTGLGCLLCPTVLYMITRFFF